MSDNLTIFGTDYTGVTGIKATGTGNGTLTYIRPQGTKSISANGTGIDVAAYASVDVAVQGGPDVPTFTATSGQLGELTNISCDRTFAELLDYLDTNLLALVEVDAGGETMTFGATLYTVSPISAVFSMNAGAGGTPIGDITMASSGACTWSSPSTTTTTLTATANGTYSDQQGRTYSEVTVAVPSSAPSLQAKSATPTTSQQTITADSGYDGLSQVTVNAMPTGTAGTPTATKGTVSNHSVSVTPSVTNTTGYITGGTKTGTAITVSASELVSGSETKTANGTYDVSNLASLVVALDFVTYYTSSSNPTSSQGSNGDIWLVTS